MTESAAQTVARYDYAYQLEGARQALSEKIDGMLEKGDYVLGGEVKRFEEDFGRYLGVAHTLGVNSGTDALILGLRALGIGPGDEVITQANTFHATVAAIIVVGATPVLVDADETTFLMDCSQLSGAVTPRTKAIIPVHLFGKPTDMTPIETVASEHGLAVVEDAAQAHGASIDGRMTGAVGTIGCFSFHPSKNLAAAGDAGAVVTNDDAIAERIRSLRSLGQSAQNEHIYVGLNSKLDAIQAVVLQHKLKMLDVWNDQRIEIASEFRDGLADLPVFFQDPGGANEKHVYHLFQVGCDARDDLLEHLAQAGIDATVRYPTPIHLQKAFEDQGWSKGQFPTAERLARSLLCLPIRPGMPRGERTRVIQAIRLFFGK